MQLSLLQSQTVTQPQGTWQIPTELPDLSRIPRFGGDSETNSLNVFTGKAIGISLAWYDESGKVQKIYAPWGHVAGNLEFEKVKRWCEDSLRGKTGYFSNAKFDVAMLRNAGLDLEALDVKVCDVAFNAALLEDSPRGGLGIDNLARLYTNERKFEFPGNPNRMAEYPSWMAGEYAEQDAKLPLLVHDATVPLLRKDGLEELLALENDLIYFVCEIERNGCRIDVPKLFQWREEVRKELETVLLKIHRETGFLVQPNSGNDMRRLFQLLGLQPPALPVWKCHVCKAKNEPMAMKCWRCDVRKRAGKPTYTEEQLLAFKNPVLDDVVRARWLDDLLGSFLDKFWAGLDGDTVRSQYHQLKGDKHGTVSGRFSSTGGGTDDDGYTFNSQQTIKTSLQMKTLGDRWIVRELLIPKEGDEMWAADASQIEYRLFGHFANSQKIINAYLEDENADFHQLVMDMILPVKPDIDRDTAKNTNFSRLYRAQAPTFAATAGISVAEAERILEIYDRVLPEADTFSTEKENEAKNRGYVTTILGRRARFGPNDRTYSAANRVVQGSAADLFKTKLRTIYRERKTLGITRLRQPVHDEQVGDKDPDPKYTKRIQECFNEQEIDLRIPIIWSLKTGQTWKDCK